MSYNLIKIVYLHKGALIYFYLNTHTVSITPGERNGNPLQYSCQENAMDRGAWRATVHGSEKQLDTTERLNHHKGEKQPDVLAEQTQPSRQTAPSIL